MPLTQVPSAMMQVGGVPSFDGIKFPASQVTSADANTLDDYEEGTWTPTLTNFSGTVTAGFPCRYTKVGNLVTVAGVIVSSSGTISGSGLIISGLPFTSGTQFTACATHGAFGSTPIPCTRLPAGANATEALTPYNSVSAITGTGILNLALNMSYQI